MEGIYLFNIDSLESVVEENKAQREGLVVRNQSFTKLLKGYIRQIELFNGAPYDGIAHGKAERIRRRGVTSRIS